MAKKTKKADDGELGPIVDKLISEVGDDRERLVNFLDKLIQNYDGESAVGIAEYVAKLADALTRQHQVKTSVVKALAKQGVKDDDSDDLDGITDKIGLPFKNEAEDDSAN